MLAEDLTLIQPLLKKRVCRKHSQIKLLYSILRMRLSADEARQLAPLLLARFGSVAEALSAPGDQLAEVANSAAVTSFFSLLRQVVTCLTEEELTARPLIGSTASLVRHCRATMGYEPIEYLRLFFLDSSYRLILDEWHGRGTIDHTAAYPREILKRALQLNAMYLIIVHNHPSGNPAPSVQDIAMTREIAMAARTVGVEVTDHVIIGRQGHYSLAEAGKL